MILLVDIAAIILKRQTQDTRDLSQFCHYCHDNKSQTNVVCIHSLLKKLRVLEMARLMEDTTSLDLVIIVAKDTK